MVRTLITPTRNFYDKAVAMKDKPFMQHLKPEIVPWLLFSGEHHFNHMPFNSRSQTFPNGYHKLGTIRYKSDHIRLPASQHLFAFESSEFNAGMAPRGSLRLDHVVVCPLEELTPEEIMMDGFDSHDDMLYQMTEMEGRYYQDLTPASLVSYFKFGALSRLGDDPAPAYFLKKLPHWNSLKEQDRIGWTNRV